MPDRLTAALADRYRLERDLGQGGMATVYLAQDLRHNRRVAVKVLRPELAAVIGAERFLTEITTTANLQHPHILPLFDSGEADSFLFYVMPFIEGETVRNRLDREKQLPIADAVRIATEVAAALDYAHRRNIIHRDIKPENILLHDGSALVADFGIALAASKAGGSRMTETGMSLGTPHYMSPEQAMGEREITARSDVYALGCVMYEMLTGEPPFTGPTAQAIVAKVMTDKPPSIRRQRERVPDQLEDAVLTALEKLPADRFATAAEFASALASAGAGGLARPSRQAAPRSGRRLLTAGLLGAGCLALFLGARSAAGGGNAVEFGRSASVTWDPDIEVLPALSPDGRSVAYAAGGSASSLRVFVRPVAGGRPVALINDSLATQSAPRWSPDGTRVLFLARGGVFSAPASGGPARQEVPIGAVKPVTAAVWSPDGRQIAYAIGDSLFVRPEGGTPRWLATFLEPSLCTWSPDARYIACASGNAQYSFANRTFGNTSPSRIVAVRVSDGAVRDLTGIESSNQSPVWLDRRTLLFVSNRNGPRDVHAVSINGDGQPSSLRRLTVGLGAHSISLDARGARLAYSVYSATANIWSLPLPATGPASADSATPLTFGNQTIETMQVSADAKWVYYASNVGGDAEAYRVPVQGGEPERLTTHPADDFAPDQSPDGREIAFHSWRTGNREIFVMPLDGGPVQQVTHTEDRQELMPTWSPNGSALTFFEFQAVEDTIPQGSLWVVRRDARGQWGDPVERSPAAGWAEWSPDGRHIAFARGVAGMRLLVVPSDSGPVRTVYDVSRTGGPQVEQVMWSDDGQEIYFKSHGADGAASIWAVPTAGGTPRQLVHFGDRPSYRFNMAAGGGRLYFTLDERRSDVWVMELER